MADDYNESLNYKEVFEMIMGECEHILPLFSTSPGEAVDALCAKLAKTKTNHRQDVS